MDKKDKKMSMDKLAKMDLLKSLRKMAMDMINEGGEEEMDSLKKVTVAAKDEEGLKAGLEKAEDILESKMEGEDEEELADAEEKAPEDEIAALEAKLAALKAKKDLKA